jgi:hypothetical protein
MDSHGTITWEWLKKMITQVVQEAWHLPQSECPVNVIIFITNVIFSQEITGSIGLMK